MEEMDVKKTGSDILREEKENEIIQIIQNTQTNTDNAICELTMMFSMMTGGI